MFYVFLIKSSFQAFPGSPVVEPIPPMLGVWVPSLVWELRSHMPPRVDKKLKKKKKVVVFIWGSLMITFSPQQMKCCFVFSGG